MSTFKAVRAAQFVPHSFNLPQQISRKHGRTQPTQTSFLLASLITAEAVLNLNPKLMKAAEVSEKFLMMAAITCGARINCNRLLFNIFKDMVTPGSRQAKGYAIQIILLLENVPNLELGESLEFPSSKVLTEKTVHRYIVLNDKVGMEVVTTEPRVKKTPVKKATKRPATDAAVAPVVKKKRTTKKEDRKLILNSDDDIVDSEPVVGGSIVGEAAAEVVGDTAEKEVEPVVESVEEQQTKTTVGISEAETTVDNVDDVDVIIDQAYSKFISHPEMASSLFINTVHVCFESVLAMDNAGMVAMFESLVDTGLKGFLGCPAVIHEADLLNRGLDRAEIPKDLVFDARSIVSLSGEPVSVSGKNKEMTIEFRLLCDILAKTISVKAGSFDAITQEKFLMMAAITCGARINCNRLLFNIFKDMVTPGSRQAKGYAIQIRLLLKNVPNLELGESLEFPSSKVLTEKTVHRYIVLNDKVGMEVVTTEPRVKKTPVKKATKRPATDAAVAPVTKTTVGISEAETAVDNVDDVDVIIEQVIAETAQLETDEGELVDEPDVSRAAAEDQAVEKADEVYRWFDLPYEVLIAGNTEQMVTTAGDTDEEFIADQVFGIGVEEMETEDVEQSADEAMLLEDILMTIPVDCPLPSVGVEITKIILGKTISIPGVNEGDWYKVSLPKIPTADKGKAPLLERDPVKGNPIKEQFSLILADIEVLVMLREKIIEDVDRFFNSFSLKRLATLKIDESYFDKEALILSWAETDSTRVSLNRRTYILTKYRELLIRKFLEARKINFTLGEGSSATDLKVLEMLYALHMFVVEELKEQTMAHGLKWEKTCCSKIFEGRPRDPGAIIARTNTNTLSTCWIRTMIRVEGVWVIEPCADHWVTIPREVVNNEISRQRSYDDTLPLVNAFFRVMRMRWADVCMEVAQFVSSDRLLPVGSLNFCRTLAVVEPVFVFVSRQSPVISWRLSQLCTTFIWYNLFSSLSTADIRSFVSTIAFERTVFRDVQIVQSSVSAIPSVQSSFASADRSYVKLLLDQRPQSPSTTADSSMHFVEDDTQLEDVSAPDQYFSTFSATAVTTSIDALRESFSNFVATQSKDSRQTNNALGEVMNKIYHVKRVFLDSIAEHNETFRGRVAAYALTLTGFFYCQIPPVLLAEGHLNMPNLENVDMFNNKYSNTDFEKHKDDEHGDSDNLDVKSCGGYSISNSNLSFNPPMLQKGVLRTNCIDCLNRTNVAKYAYGLAALGCQLRALGVTTTSKIDLDDPLAEEMSFYERMGETLAHQYGGSAAHNKVSYSLKLSCFGESIDELEATPTIGVEEESVRKGYSISLHRAKLVWKDASWISTLHQLSFDSEDSEADQLGEQLKHRICSDIGGRLETSWLNLNQLDEKNKSS
ncbi:hypothetical protein F511_39850 [Dorcoceras hygrometricum]|uniref:SAC domain-containing protein n=1 Tax=Dorcoceras hygrometricum TaxID=472368 RepID=A0A2Z7ACE0_9LAMI|nr:hypothetical protein F511_39850 [Dorcoceras hygrometricum]